MFTEIFTMLVFSCIGVFMLFGAVVMYTLNAIFERNDDRRSGNLYSIAIGLIGIGSLFVAYYTSPFTLALK